MNNFAECLKCLYWEFADQELNQKRRQDPTHQELKKEYRRLLSAVQAKLPEEDRGMILDLEGAALALFAHENESIYLKGITDCVTMLKAIQII